jgi:hypothetical protein
MIHTDDLILKLSNDLKNPSESKHWFVRYWSTWTLCTALLIIMTYIASILAPAEVHPPENFGSSIFRIEVFTWLGIAILASVIAYLSSIPNKLKSFLIPTAYISIAALTVSLLARLNFANLAQEFKFEMQLWRGPCGFFIAIGGVVSALTVFSITRRAAPLSPQKTAFWTSLSLGAFAASLMHMVCTHSTSLHVIMWHVVPLFCIITLAHFYAEKLLRW